MNYDVKRKALYRKKARLNYLCLFFVFFSPAHLFQQIGAEAFSVVETVLNQK